MQRNVLPIAVTVAAVCVIGAIAVAVGFWRSVGGGGISAAGWLAMALGAVLSLALGIGLMTLVFFSSRGGYDDIGRDISGPPQAPAPPERNAAAEEACGTRGLNVSSPGNSRKIRIENPEKDRKP
jgi:hypothetical protein